MVGQTTPRRPVLIITFLVAIGLIGHGHAASPDVLVLGCTHFPPLAGSIRAVAGDSVRIVDSAVTTAGALASLLAEAGITSRETNGVCQFLVTDGEERFARVGPVFLGRAIAASAVERVNL